MNKRQTAVDRANRTEAAALETLSRAAEACNAAMDAHTRATKRCAQAREKIHAARDAAAALHALICAELDANPANPRLIELYHETKALDARAHERLETINVLMDSCPFQN